MAAGSETCAATSTACTSPAKTAAAARAARTRAMLRFIDFRLGTPPLLRRCLVELDWVAVRIVDEDLPATRPRLDLVPERHPRFLQRGDGRIDAVDIQHDPIPPAGLLLAAVRHRARARSPGAAQDEIELAARNQGKPRPRPHSQVEAEMAGVKRDRAVDAGSLVANDRGVRRERRGARVGRLCHRGTSPGRSQTRALMAS